MKTKRLTQALERVEAWPAHAQDELAEKAAEVVTVGVTFETAKAAHAQALAEALAAQAELQLRVEKETAVRHTTERELRASLTDTERTTTALKADLDAALQARQAEAASHEQSAEAARHTEAELARRLEAAGLTSANHADGRETFLTTGDAAQVAPVLGHVWGQAVAVAHVDI